jgi:hypothetical protein
LTMRLRNAATRTKATIGFVRCAKSGRGGTRVDTGSCDA